MRRLALICLVVLLGLTGARAEILEQILVKVNGEILTKTDLELRQLQTLRQRGDIDPARLDEVDLNRALTDITPQILVEAVNEMLLMQRARDLGVSLTDDQFKTLVDSIRKEQNLERDEDFQAALKQQGLTMNDLRRLFERQTLVGRVTQVEIMSRIDVTEEESRRYFETHPDQFTAQPGITLREILIGVAEEAGGISVGKDEEAQKLAATLRDRVLKGERFETLASEHSTASSRANGGLIGPIGREDLAPQFQELIDPLKPGEMTAVVRTTQGYQLFRLEQRTESDRLTFEQARGQIADRIAGEKLQGERERYIATLRQNAVIVWKNDELRKAYEQGLVRQPSA